MKQQLKSVTKFFVGFILTILFIVLVYINYGLHYQPAFMNTGGSAITSDLVA